MKRALFVTNGHGEASIGERIAQELRAVRPAIEIDHVALVGDGVSVAMTDAGPRRSMPSGGLIAMGNMRNIARDAGAGLLGLTAAQLRFLRSVRGRYDVAVAVGDVYAFLMTRIAGAPTVFVGTAKSVEVAPYGRLERRLLRAARACFVRDEATMRQLAAAGVRAEAANVIVDLWAVPDDSHAADAVEDFDPAVALFPGSRASAYENAGLLLDVTRLLVRDRPALGAVLSIAPGLDAGRFAARAQTGGWQVAPAADSAIPFVLGLDGRTRARAWSGALGPLLRRVSLVLGQAGTANEAAAAAGVGVIAFESDRESGMWYRRRQRALLGDALAVFPASLEPAAAGVAALLNDSARRAHMGATGRSRMGPAGGARRIADRIVVVGES